MATALGNDAAPKIAQGGIFVRSADTPLADWTAATVNAMLADAGTYIIPGVEEVTEDTADGDTKLDSFGSEYILFTTSEGAAVSFRLTPEGYNTLKSLADSDKVDIFFVTGSITESNNVVVAGDRAHYWYDQAGKVTKSIPAADAVNVSLTWSTRTATGEAGSTGWESVVA